MVTKLTWYEFFAGGGMARLGLGLRWKCVFANEWSKKKACAYTNYFGAGNPKHCAELKVEDVAKLTTADLKENADLAWGSFPCQDLSLAGNGAGLNGDRSGTFKPFWKLMASLAREGRAPRLIVLENVVGTITSHGGQDFRRILTDLSETGYRVGAMVIDAVRFLPQSRPRLFIVAAAIDVTLPSRLTLSEPAEAWHPASLRRAYGNMPGSLRESWIWWNLPESPRRKLTLTDIIEDEPTGVDWHSREHTQYLLGLMSAVNRRKVDQVRAFGQRRVGTIYRRTRPNEEGEGQQRAEVRFDDISGCLRTPAGGSSRQTVMIVEDGKVRTRLLSPREAARLMGVPESYPLPESYNEAYHLFGDGLAVPAVSWLNEHLLLPLAQAESRQAAA
jgi:DNA (cytosine-5)-methyltransferase 1